MAQINNSQPSWPVHVFQINLETLQRNSWAQPCRTSLDGNETVTEADQMKNTRTSLLSNLFPGAMFVTGYNGYQFTAYGMQAVYYKNLYVKGQPDDILKLIS